MYSFTISGFSDEISSDFDVQMKTILDLGINYFDIRTVDGENIANLSFDKILEIKSKIDELGILVACIGSPVGKDDISEDFEPQKERFLKIVKTAKALDCKYIRIFSYFANSPKEREEMKDEVIKRLSEFVKIAERENVVLLHENEKDIFGEDIKSCKYLFENIKSDNFRAVFDPANFVQAGQDTLKAFEELVPYIEYMHIKDAKSDQTVVPAGYGEGNVPQILKALKEKGYQGFLALEPHLGAFEGLNALEKDAKITGTSDASKYEIAFNTLKKIIEEIN